jgi:hypothetical protein
MVETLRVETLVGTGRHLRQAQLTSPTTLLAALWLLLLSSTHTSPHSQGAGVK